MLRDIERLLRQELPRTVVPGFEPGSGPAPAAEPRSERGGHTARRSQGNGRSWHNRSPGSRSQGSSSGARRSGNR